MWINSERLVTKMMFKHHPRPFESEYTGSSWTLIFLTNVSDIVEISFPLLWFLFTLRIKSMYHSINNAVPAYQSVLLSSHNSIHSILTSLLPVSTWNVSEIFSSFGSISPKSPLACVVCRLALSHPIYMFKVKLHFVSGIL